MKTHRNILIISSLISFTSLSLVIFLPTDNKIFQIALAFMGSSFISFMLELPNYISLKQSNKNKLYYSLYDLKMRISILKNITENSFNQDIIFEKYYEQHIQIIESITNILKSFDPCFHFFKKKNLIISNSIASINNAFNNLNQATLKFPCEYYSKQCEIIKFENNNRLLSPEEMKDELNLIIEMCINLIDIINITAKTILNKNEIAQWIIDDSIITNVIANFKIVQK